MIKFFRHIRQRLLSENRFSKYLLYAIGEIALVIIGILLALQINNWNENRKQEQELIDLLSVFEAELETNIESSTRLLIDSYNLDSISTRYKNDQMDRQDLWEVRGTTWMLRFGTSTRRFIDDHLDELIATEKRIPESYRFLTPQFKELKRRIESQRKWEQQAIEISSAYRKEMSDRYPWFNLLPDSLARDQLFEHALADPIYKSKVLHYQDFHLDENNWDASLIRTSSIAILWHLKQIRGTSPDTIEEFLDGFGLKPFHEAPCGSLPIEIEDGVNIPVNGIYYNNRSDTIHCNRLNLQGEHRGSIAIAPNSFYLDEFSIGSWSCIEVLKEDTCSSLYYKSKQDYLIFN